MASSSPLQAARSTHLSVLDGKSRQVACREASPRKKKKKVQICGSVINQCVKEGAG